MSTAQAPANRKSPPRAAGRPGAAPIKTWAFDSAGTRKYALQIARASNGNPCLRLVEGVPQPDGTFRKFSLNVWSEDFDALFTALDEVRTYIRDNNIRTPPGHKYEPSKRQGRPRAA
jgi:hypothetical protein